MSKHKTHSAPASKHSQPKLTLLQRSADEEGATPPDATVGQRERMIAEAAYYRAERRGFAPGAELEDWLAAEAEVSNSLMRDLSEPSELH